MAESKVSCDHTMTCSLCLDTFKDPKVLPCAHTFCQSCLSSWIETTHSCTHFPCPLCKKDIMIPKGLRNLANNTLTQKILDDDVNEDKKSQGSDNVEENVERDNDKPNKRRRTDLHKTLGLPLHLSFTLCFECTNSSVSSHCRTCSLLLCHRCGEKHADKNCILQTSYAVDRVNKKKIDVKMKALKERIAAVASNQEYFGKIIAKDKNDIIATVRNQANALRNEISHQEDVFVERLAEYFKEKESACKIFLPPAKEEIDDLSDLIIFPNENIDNGGHSVKVEKQEPTYDCGVIHTDSHLGITHDIHIANNQQSDNIDNGAHSVKVEKQEPTYDCGVINLDSHLGITHDIHIPNNQQSDTVETLTRGRSESERLCQWASRCLALHDTSVSGIQQPNNITGPPNGSNAVFTLLTNSVTWICVEFGISVTPLEMRIHASHHAPGVVAISAYKNDSNGGRWVKLFKEKKRIPSEAKVFTINFDRVDFKTNRFEIGVVTGKLQRHLNAVELIGWS